MWAATRGKRGQEEQGRRSDGVGLGLEREEAAAQTLAR